MRGRTERDSRVLVPDVIALLVGEEHVRGKTTLGGVGICRIEVSDTLTTNTRWRQEDARATWDDIITASAIEPMKQRDLDRG
jgi:hypothetical protein